MEEYYDIQILLDKSEQESYSLGETVKGEIVVFPEIDLDIEILEYNVFLEAKGKMSSHKTTLAKGTLMNHTILQQGEEYRFPVEFTNSVFETYKGKNVNFTVKLEVYLDIHDEQRKEIDPGILKHTAVGRFFGSDKKYRKSVILDFSSQADTYEIVPGKVELSAGKNYMIGVLVVLIFGGVAAGVMFNAPGFGDSIFGMLFLLVFGLILLYFLYSMVMKNVIGQISISFEHLQDNRFKQVVRNDKNWSQTSKVFISFRVVEEVVDDRGTSSTTYTTKIYSSVQEEVSRPYQNVHMEFDFPADAPPTMKVGDARIYWETRVKAVTRLGMPINYKGEFQVRKVKSVRNEE